MRWSEGPGEIPSKVFVAPVQSKMDDAPRCYCSQRSDRRKFDEMGEMMMSEAHRRAWPAKFAPKFRDIL